MAPTVGHKPGGIQVGGERAEGCDFAAAAHRRKVAIIVGGERQTAGREIDLATDQINDRCLSGLDAKANGWGAYVVVIAWIGDRGISRTIRPTLFDAIEGVDITGHKIQAAVALWDKNFVVQDESLSDVEETIVGLGGINSPSGGVGWISVSRQRWRGVDHAYAADNGSARGGDASHVSIEIEEIEFKVIPVTPADLGIGGQVGG